MTVRLFSENFTRATFELGCSPSPASITPALTSSSLYLVISSRSLSSGRMPASESAFALTRTMNRIVFLYLLSYTRRTAHGRIDTGFGIWELGFGAARIRRGERPPDVLRDPRHGSAAYSPSRRIVG